MRRDVDPARAASILRAPAGAQSGGRVIGVEVKAASSFRGAQFAGLRKLRDRLGHRFLAGVVLNTGTTGYRLEDRLIGLPVSALWEL
jgi:hypothetical protein